MHSLWARIWRRRRDAPKADALQAPTLQASDEASVQRLRARGVRIGEGCRIYATEFSTEPYLVALGDNVGVAGGVKFLAHNGAAHLLRTRRPAAQSFGRIVVGSNCFIGEDALILGGTTIGDGCIVIAGAVVHGRFPENSVVAGNPARVVGRASLFLERLNRSPDTLDTFGLALPARRAVIETHFAWETAGDPRRQP